MLNAAADLRRAVRVDATDRSQFRIAENFTPAGWTLLRHLEFLLLPRARLGIHADHGGDDFTRFFDKDPVADADVFAGNLFLVV